MTKKAVLFDLDDTLYKGVDTYTKGLDLLITKWREKYPELNEEQTRELYEKARSQTFLRLTSANAGNRLLHLLRMAELTNQKLDFAWALQTEKEYWDEFMKYCKARPGAVELVKELKKRGLKTAIVTNMDLRTQIRKLVAMGMDNLFDVVMTNEEIGVAKPSPAIFLLCLEKLGVKVEETLMVGDDMKSDIYGAQAMGMETVLIENHWYKYSEEDRLAATHHIEELSEVLKFI